MQQKGPPAGEAGKIVLISLIVLLVVAGVVFFLISKGIVKNPFQGIFSKSNLGSQIFKEIQDSSGDKGSDTNPFAKVNPFKGVYKNPFE